MDQPSTPTPLLNKDQLKEWLGISDFWVKDRLRNDPEFVERCVIDLAPEGSERRTLRFHPAATAAYLRIPADSQPAATAVTVPAQRSNPAA